MTRLSHLNNVNEPGAALADSACRMLVLMDDSLDFMELVGRRGVIEGVSSAITDLAGYEPKDLIGQHFRELVHPEDRAAAERAFAQVLGADAPARSSFAIEPRTAPGARCWRAQEITWRIRQRGP